MWDSWIFHCLCAMVGAVHTGKTCERIGWLHAASHEVALLPHTNTAGVARFQSVHAHCSLSNRLRLAARGLIRKLQLFWCGGDRQTKSSFVWRPSAVRLAISSPTGKQRTHLLWQRFRRHSCVMCL